MKFWSLLVLTGAITACASSPMSSPSLKPRRLTYDEVKSLEPGKTHLTDLKRKLGEPDLILPATGENEQMLVYDRGRLRLMMDSQSLLLKTIGWSVYEKDVENDLSVVKTYFPTSVFTVDNEQWTNPHAGPTKTFHSDLKTGVTITTAIDSSMVISIFREIPNTPRKPAAAQSIKFEL